MEKARINTLARDTLQITQAMSKAGASKLALTTLATTTAPKVVAMTFSPVSPRWFLRLMNINPNCLGNKVKNDIVIKIISKPI